MEAQTAEEAKRLSKAELCGQKPVIDLQMPASRNLAVNRNINQFQRLMRGHSAAKLRHTYTLVWRSTATFICGGYATSDYFQVQYLQFIVLFRALVLVEAGQDLNMCSLIKDRLRRSYKSQLPPPQLRSVSANGYVFEDRSI